MKSFSLRPFVLFYRLWFNFSDGSEDFVENLSSHFNDCFKELFFYSDELVNTGVTGEKTKKIFFPSGCTRF